MSAQSLGEPAVQITPCPDGPLLVRGNIEIVDPVTNEVVRPGRTVALCRCGVSAIKPFCDGTHKLVNFTTTAEE